MIGLVSDKNYHISDSHRLEHREPQGQLKRTISRRHSPPYKGKGVKDIQFWCIKWARGVHKKHLLRLANFFRMNPIMNIGQKWSAWPCLQFGMPKLSVGLAIGLRLRLVILRQSQTIKLVPHKKLWQWWCPAQSRVFNGVHSMCATTATCWLCNSVQSVFHAFRMERCQICHFMKSNSQRSAVYNRVEWKT